MTRASRSRGRGFEPLILGGTALAGIVAGHFLDYMLTAHHHGEREALLRHTGHGYLPTAIALSVLGASLAVLAVVALGVRRATRDGPAGDPRPSAAVLATVQPLGFLLLEYLERFAVGAPLPSPGSRLIVVGLLVQVAVACAAALLLSMVGRLAEAAARALLRRPHVPNPAAPRFGLAAVWSARPSLLTARPPRAPPRPALP